MIKTKYRIIKILMVEAELEKVRSSNSANCVADKKTVQPL